MNFWRKKIVVLEMLMIREEDTYEIWMSTQDPLISYSAHMRFPDELVIGACIPYLICLTSPVLHDSMKISAIFSLSLSLFCSSSWRPPLWDIYYDFTLKAIKNIKHSHDFLARRNIGVYGILHTVIIVQLYIYVYYTKRNDRPLKLNGIKVEGGYITNSSTVLCCVRFP